MNKLVKIAAVAALGALPVGVYVAKRLKSKKVEQEVIDAEEAEVAEALYPDLPRA